METPRGGGRAIQHSDESSSCSSSALSSIGPLPRLCRACRALSDQRWSRAVDLDRGSTVRPIQGIHGTEISSRALLLCCVLRALYLRIDKMMKYGANQAFDFFSAHVDTYLFHTVLEYHSIGEFGVPCTQ
jgi:hypothetical protein